MNLTMFSPFRRLIETLREREATTPEKALTWKELGLPEEFENFPPPIPEDVNPLVRVGNRYYLSEKRLSAFMKGRGFPSPIRKWIQHTAKVPKGFLRYQVLHKLKENPMSGAELTASIEDELQGRWRPKPGSIYPLLRSLLQDGLTRELHTTDGRTRRYELTDKGLEFLESEIDSSGELREKIDQGFTPFSLPFLQVIERIEEKSPSLRNLFLTLHKLRNVIDIDEDLSPEILEELTRAVEQFATTIDKIAKKIQAQKRSD